MLVFQGSILNNYSILIFWLIQVGLFPSGLFIGSTRHILLRRSSLLCMYYAFMQEYSNSPLNLGNKILES